MSDFETQFIAFIIAVLFFFIILIFFLLRLRKKIQDKNLNTPIEEVWRRVSPRVSELGLKKTDLLFGIEADVTTSVTSLVVKDSKDLIVGRIIYPRASRQRNIIIGEKSFVVELPFSWNRTARLIDSSRNTLAQYRQTGWLGRHEIRIDGFGVLRSERPVISLDRIVNYRKDSAIVGTSQEVQSFLKKGRMLVLSSELPLEIRLFILSL